MNKFAAVAITSSPQLFSDILTRVALKDIEEKLNKVEQKYTPNTDLNVDEHWQVPLSGRIKDSGVLKKNRDLDKDTDWIVDDYNDVEPLV